MSEALQETKFLNLKKMYQHFQYQSLLDGSKIVHQQQIPSVYQGMTLNTYLFVQQKDTIIKDLENLALYYRYKLKPDGTIDQRLINKFPDNLIRDRVFYILQNYQQQPSLLQPLLPLLLRPLLQTISLLLSPYKQEVNNLLLIIYTLSKIVSMKCLQNHLPHEINDFLLLYNLLKQQHNLPWQSLYVLLGWFSVGVILPFRMKDMGVQIQTVVNIGKRHLIGSNRIRDVAAQLLGKVSIRKQGRQYLPTFLQWAIKQLQESFKNPHALNFICGIYSALFRIFKNGIRDDLVPIITKILKVVSSSQINNSAYKVLKVKLMQRMGLVYLRPRVITWVYKRGSTNLLKNLTKSTSLTLQTNTQIKNVFTTNQQAKQLQQQQDVDYFKDVDWHGLCQIIDCLIGYFPDKDTYVREQVSKGLARICNRLSYDMSMDVLHHVLALDPFPTTIHTLALFLSQLSLRNLLPPTYFYKPQKYFYNQLTIIDLLSQCFLYQKQQANALSNAIRDAACYLAWSLIRGYKEDAKSQIWIKDVVKAMLYDREVGIRRGASAVFQEVCGRVGAQNGIQILTEADYFTLGIRNNAYLNVSIFVGSYQPYFQCLVEHLVFNKLRHWDLQIKKLASASLSLLVPLNPVFFVGIIQGLLKLSKSTNYNIRLGSIYGLSQIIMGMCGKSNQHLCKDEMKDSVFLKSLTKNELKLIQSGEYMSQFKQKYANINTNNNIHIIQTYYQHILQVVDQKGLKGKSGEAYRVAMNRLIQAISMAQIIFKDSIIQKYLNFLEESFKNPLELLQMSASKSLKAISKSYLRTSKFDFFVNKIIKSSYEPKGKGYIQALASLSKQQYQFHVILFYQLNQILQCIQHQFLQQDADNRKHSLKSLQQIILTIGFNQQLPSQNQIQRIFSCVFKGLKDYSTDKRGDVGIFVRCAAMHTFISIIKKNTQNGQLQKINQYVQKVIALMLQQLVQKIDSVRLLSGSLLQQYFKLYDVYKIGSRTKLSQIFNQENINKYINEDQALFDKALDTQVIMMQMQIQQDIFLQQNKQMIYYWNNPNSVYRIITPLLKEHSYTRYILEGICISAGGITQSTIKYSLLSLQEYIRGASYQQLVFLLDCIIQILKDNQKEQRIVLPVFKVLDFMFEIQEIYNLKYQRWNIFVEILNQESKTKSVPKLAAAAILYVSLLPLLEKHQQLAIYPKIIRLGTHKFPKVRKSLADKLLLFAMGLSDSNLIQQQKVQNLIQVLSQYDFLSQDLDVVQLKNRLEQVLL